MLYKKSPLMARYLEYGDRVLVDDGRYTKTIHHIDEYVVGHLLISFKEGGQMDIRTTDDVFVVN